MVKFLKSTAGAIILGVISFVFIVSFGPGSSGCQNAGPNGQVADYAMKIGDEKISDGQFREKYKEFQLNFRASRQDVSVAELTIAVLNSLLDDYIYIKEAEKLGLKVDVSERNNFIKRKSYFLVDGEFDYDKYKQVVTSYFNTTPIQYEENVDKDILIKKVQDILTSAISVNDEFVWNSFVEIKKSVKLSYIKWGVPQSEIKITDQDIDNFLKTKEKEVKDFYQKNIDRYKHGEEVKASHILIKVDKKNSDKKAKEKIAKIAKMLKNDKKSFAEIAKKYSEGPSAKKGGDLGFFTKDRMVKPFAEKAFSLKVGEVSDPVKTRFGYHLIKVFDKKVSKIDKYDDVKKDIAKRLVQKNKKDLMMKNIEKEVNGFSHESSLELITKKKEGLKIEETPNIFSYTRNISGIGSDQNLVSDALKAKKGVMLKKVYKIGGYLYLFQVKDVNLPDKKEFEKSKEIMKDRAVMMEKEAFLSSWLNKRRETLTYIIHPNYQPETSKK